MALSATLFDESTIFICMENHFPTTHFGAFGVKQPTNASVKNGNAKVTSLRQLAPLNRFYLSNPPGLV